MKKEKLEITQVKAQIKQGRLSLVKIAPKHFIEFIEALKEKHDNKIPFVISQIEEGGFSYLLITFRKEVITELVNKFNFSISQYKHPNFLIWKKHHGEFIKEEKRLLITIFHEDELPNDFKLTVSLSSNYITQFFPELNLSSKTELIEALSTIKQDNIKKLARFKPINTFLSENPIEDYELSIKPLTDGYEITLGKKSIRFELDEDEYDQFLLDSGKVASENELKRMKDIENMKGTARYFTNNLKSFINHVLQADTTSKYYQSIKTKFKDINLEDFNFENIEKRAIFHADVYVSFLPNNDIIISKTDTIKFDTGDPLKLIEENVQSILIAKHEEYERNISQDTKKEELQPISEGTLDILIDFSMKTVKFGLNVYYEQEFLDDYFYNVSIFSKFLEILILKFNLKGDKIHLLPIILAYFNALSVHFPKKIAKKSVMDFLIKNILDLTNLERKKVVSLFQYSRIFILLYQVAQELNFLTNDLVKTFLIEKIEDIFTNLSKKVLVKIDPKNEMEVIKKQILEKVSLVRHSDQIDQFLDFIKRKITLSYKIDSDQLELLSRQLKEILEEEAIHANKLELARVNAGKIIKTTITQLNARPDIIAAGGLMLVLIAMDMSKKIRPYQISNILGIDTTSLPRQTKKMVALDEKDSTEFDSLEISSKYFRVKAKKTVINQLVNVFVLSLIKMMKEGKKTSHVLIDDLEDRLKFIKEGINYSDKFELINDDLQKLIHLLPNEFRKRIEQLLHSTSENGIRPS